MKSLFTENWGITTPDGWQVGQQGRYTSTSGYENWSFLDRHEEGDITFFYVSFQEQRAQGFPAQLWATIVEFKDGDFVMPAQEVIARIRGLFNLNDGFRRHQTKVGFGLIADGEES